MLREYGISWTGFSAAIVGALLVGKVVLIVDKLPFVNKFPDRPMMYKASWKSLIYLFSGGASCPLPGACQEEQEGMIPESIELGWIDLLKDLLNFIHLQVVNRSAVCSLLRCRRHLLPQ